MSKRIVQVEMEIDGGDRLCRSSCRFAAIKGPFCFLSEHAYHSNRSCHENGRDWMRTPVCLKCEGRQRDTERYQRIIAPRKQT